MLLKNKYSKVYYWWYINFFWFWWWKMWRRNSDEKTQIMKSSDDDENSDEKILLKRILVRKILMKKILVKKIKIFLKKKKIKGKQRFDKNINILLKKLKEKAVSIIKNVNGSYLSIEEIIIYHIESNFSAALKSFKRLGQYEKYKNFYKKKTFRIFKFLIAWAWKYSRLLHFLLLMRLYFGKYESMTHLKILLKIGRREIDSYF